MLEVASAIALVFLIYLTRLLMQFKLINGDLDRLLRQMISCEYNIFFLINFFFVNFNMIDDIP